MIQRRAVAGIVFAATMSMVAACGFQSPDVESGEHASIQATDFSVGVVRVRDAFITSDSTTGASPTVYLVVTFVNGDLTNGDALTSITTPLGAATMSGAGVIASGATGGALTLPPKGVPVEVGTAELSPNGPTITIAAATAPPLGTFVPVKFTFASGSSPTEQLPVVPPGETTQPTQPVPTAVATPPVPEGVSASD